MSRKVTKDVPMVYTKTLQVKSLSVSGSPLSENMQQPTTSPFNKSDSDTIKKEESSDEESLLSELSSSPETSPEFHSLVE